MAERYVTSRAAAAALGLHPNTLRRYADNGIINTIRTPSGQRRYDVDGYLRVREQIATVCYCRVSTYKQRADLDRQVEYMQAQYPDAEVVRDIGSGLNFRRREGLLAILERAAQGNRIRLVVTGRDRLARFGFDLIRWMVERSGGEIVVLNQRELSPNAELVRDIIAIVTVFSTRLHGLRSYAKSLKEDTAISDR